MCNFKLGNFGDSLKGGADPMEFFHKSKDGKILNNVFDPLRLRDSNRTKETTTTLPYVGPKSYSTPAAPFSSTNPADTGTVIQEGAIAPTDTAATKKKLELF